MVTIAMKLKDACSLEGILWWTYKLIKKQRHLFVDKGLYSQSYSYSNKYIQMWQLDHKAEHWRTGSGENAWESLGLQGAWTSHSQRKSILNIHWKHWSWNPDTLATWCEELTHWKRPWYWVRLKTKGEGSRRGWDG